MVMSVDQMNLLAYREPISMRFWAVEVEVVPAKPGMNVPRKTSLSAACRIQIPGTDLSGELLQMVADCCQQLRHGKPQQINPNAND